MGRFLLLLLITIPAATATAQIKNLWPSSSNPLLFSDEGEQAFNTNTPNGSFDNLSTFKSQRIDTAASGRIDTVYDEVIVRDYEDYWDVLMPGCSWYCGGRIDSIIASSALPSQGTVSYNAKNAGDFSYKTAWVEGVKGPGVGEFLEYIFLPESARVEEIRIANGYVKSAKAWQENARVKKLKLYYNGKPCAILNLKNERSEQVFRVGPFGQQYYKLEDNKKPDKPWTLRFEIVEVYQGTRYADTAISEIHFMGYDEH